MLRGAHRILVVLYGATIAVLVHAADVRPTCPTPNEKDYFFPQGLLHSARADLDDFVRAWYSGSLRVMKEPSLSCGKIADSQVYRFLWLRTFHRPISIRITHSKNSTALVAVELTGVGGYEPGSIARRIEKTVTTAEWKRLETVLSRTTFWNMPPRPPELELGFDGAQWIIEGRRPGQYHVVDRWTPKKGSYRDAGLYFLRLSGLSVPEQELY